MRKHFTAIILIIFCVAFAIYTNYKNCYKNVLTVYSPTKLGLDLNKNRIIDSDEIVCVDNLEAFSLEPTDKFVAKYSKEYNLSKNDIISLGYLAQEFVQKRIENSDAKVKFTGKVTTECRFADVTFQDYDYKTMLLHSGFGISNGKVGDLEKFRKNLASARKLHLVILNHNSGKFHTLDCPYGNVARDIVIIPERQLPTNAKPCKFCHKTKSKNKKYKFKKDFNIFNLPQIPQPPMTLTEGSITTYLTDFTRQLKPNNECKTAPCKAFVNLVDNSKTSIDIAIFGYNEIPAITDALQKAKNRGVKIRFIYDEPFDVLETYYNDNRIIKNLASVSASDRNLRAKSSSNYLMHNKFVIFDEATVYTGSMNFSSTGLSGYDVNDIVVIQSKEVADLYQKEFEQMLKGKFHTAKEKLPNNRTFKLGDTAIEIYFSPKDKSSGRIVQILKSAKKYIYVPAFLITHQGISTELINAKNRGVDVRIILDANSTSTKNSKHKILRSNGIQLKTENYAGKLHSKMIIVDDEYLITGSMNFSNSGEDKNDENLLIINDSKIAKLHKDFFLYLWTMIPNKYLKFNARPESKESVGSCSDSVDNNFNGKIDQAEELCK